MRERFNIDYINSIKNLLQFMQEVFYFFRIENYFLFFSIQVRAFTNASNQGVTSS
ncbi:hypothetical protein EDF67_10965 [Sphingobacterium sp. JUb78]|nr:hypothetical protein [Sphingobacterium kitahiroshimense]TCR05929.1 hypothetical protein EDF67_10965 [Sphingobacterium sp. JUb78]